MPEPIVYTVDDAAQLLNVSVYTIRELIKSGKLPAKKIGREYRILIIDMLDYMQLQQNE